MQPWQDSLNQWIHIKPVHVIAICQNGHFEDKCTGVADFCIMPLRFYERLMLAPCFSNRKQSKEDLHLYEN